jgi:uncharacterized membrane protein YgcG
VAVVRSLLRRLAPGLVLVVLFPACSPSKSYSFPSVRIDATVHPDGSLSLVEQRTFDFHGHFHYAFFTVEHKQFDDVTDFAVREGDRTYTPGTATTAGHMVFDDNVLEGPGGFKYKATWYFDAQDHRRTFTISYRVQCAVDVYPDTAHLLWKFIGEGWTVPTEHAVVTVHLPGSATNPPARPEGSCFPSALRVPSLEPPANPGPLQTTALLSREVRAWGHGPLQGTVAFPDPQTVRYDVRDMVPGAILEGSILFPTSAVPLEAQQFTPKRAAILAQEASFSQEANAFRRAAIRTEHRRAVFRWMLIAWAIGLLVMAIGLVLLGRRRDRIPGAPRTLTEPPEPSLHPAKLAMRWAFARRRSGLGDAFRAELLTLAAMQAVDVRPVGTVTQAKDFTLTLKQVPTEALDEKFADFLFPGDKPVDLDKLEPDEGQREDLRSWRRTLEADTKEQFPKGSSRAETEALGWAVLASLTAGIVFGIFAANVPLGLGLFLEAFVLWHVARRLLPPRPTQAAAAALSGWKAFRRYLRQFSSLKEAPAASVVIWERYLAFAVALGVAKEVEKQVKSFVPVEDLPAPWPGAPTGLNGLSFYASFQSFHSLSSLTSVAASNYDARSSSLSSSSSFSSDSGMGGGFSDGGGGGGGGTGGGAG